MKFVSVCSGIEAASLALNPLGFEAVGFSEVDPFCCELLKQRFPNVTNLGDLTQWHDWDLPKAEMLIGGTPCQGFSVAGNRGSMSDDRSNLAFNFVELFHAGGFDCALWENVPGVLNTDDNAFGCFLGGLVGADDSLREPPDGRWPSAGMASGPRARVAWRVLDSQHFGVAQRRRRVFVVASARDWLDPAKILFEPKSVPWDSSARGEARQDIAGTLSARTQGGGELGTDLECSGSLVPFSQSTEFGQFDQKLPTQRREGADCGHGSEAIIAIQERACEENPAAGPGGKGWRDDGVAYTLEARQQSQAVCFGGNNTSGPIDVATAMNAHGGPNGRCDFESETFVTHALTGEGFDASEDGTGRGTPLEPMAFDPIQVTSKENRSQPKPGAACHTLPADRQAPCLAYGGAIRGREGGSQLELIEEKSPALRVCNGGSSHAIAFQSIAGVRRLMPVECERLQSIPDGWTDITYRGKPAADGNRYKAVGNSWTVYVVRWIGKRIKRQADASLANESIAA